MDEYTEREGRREGATKRQTETKDKQYCILLVRNNNPTSIKETDKITRILQVKLESSNILKNSFIFFSKTNPNEIFLKGRQISYYFTFKNGLL